MFRAWEATAAAALHTARRRDDGAGLARMHRVVAGAKDFQGRNTSAISHCTRALGERYVRAGRLPEAIQAWRDARQTYIELGFDKDAASLTRRLAGAGAEPRP
ncbi:hypothetical protein [Paractinoplanes hotanensis]|uniref:Tetratricopeptide repeat protein n=1 Tax=Paractinoplanes hotanensis TaxID=2906497 RepID=A0ABT0YDV8_9ACTN|nr:hypothetical protein [Actinoplanes hotanensis]MCM4083434.1 hypothetical protein [Actinoplanes hotanensis]